MSEQLARQFHEIYERLAPSFGYETRTETRAFEPTTPNGRLMIAVTDEIEAAIQQRIAELTAELARRDEELAELNDKAVFIQFENEDELPADISGNVYDVMFRCSHVDGVRLFPYIEENGQKYFLVMLKEEE